MAKKKKSQEEVDEVTYLLLPPDGGYGWVVAVAGFLAMFLGEGTMCSFGLYMKDISNDFGTTEKIVAFANSTMSGFYFVFGPIMCALVNRFGFRCIGVSGGIVAGAAFFGASYLNDVTSFIFVFGAVGGIGFSMLYFSSMLVVAVYFEKWRAVAISIALCGGTAGSMAIPQIILVAFNGYTWRQQFRYFAGLAVLCGFVTILYKPLQPFEIKTAHGDQKRKPSTTEDDLSEFLQMYSMKSEESIVTVKATRSTRSTKSMKSRISEGRRDIRVKQAVHRHRRKHLSTPQRCAYCWTCKCCKECDWDTCCLNCCELCCCCIIERRCCILRGRPMNRQDILYTGSVAVIPEHRKASESRMGMLEYHMSVTGPVAADVAKKEKKVCLCCPSSITATLTNMLDVKTTKIPSFNLVMLNSFLITLAYYSPPIYITQKAKAENVPDDIANIMLTAFGAAALFGRVMCVLIASFPHVNTLLAISISSVLCGLCIITDNVSEHYMNHIFTMVAFGVCGSVCYSLRTPMIVQLYGLASLSSSFGLCMMGYGLAGFIGVPLSAILYESTGSYKMVFYYIGALGLLAGVVLFPVLCMRPKELEKEAAAAAQQPGTTSQSAAKPPPNKDEAKPKK